ncbi:Uma2 family endonuclease [Nocardioides carbamazepini]|uniref:Uma2 family endonuclease n=1 Tax=Nocardioides carbamazepini TaxID=2854259 RepID=UPI00214A2004|nr:Uma2 family endonuclease [Nocardioides carbamazepini]MCR1784853.1 Uma2 family endonuclease [Nocardioides carbamazepini]
MSTTLLADTPGIERVPMSFDEFRSLPDKPKSEWVDGVAVIYTVAPVSRHASLQYELAYWFRTHFPDLWGGTEADTMLPANRMRRPDLALTVQPPQGPWIEGTEAPPLIVVEILSPTTRSEDLLRKAPEYAAAGITQYWVVDPDGEPSIEVNQLTDGAWINVARVSEATPTTMVAVPGHDDVELDFREILRQ